MTLDHIQARTVHGRLGGPANSFRYGVDFVLFEVAEQPLPRLFSRNRFNLWHVDDRDHGGERGAGRGAAWFRDLLAARGCPLEGTRLMLLTQPAFLWFRFTPVSFWIAMRDDRPCAIVAEVNSTFGQRHCYLCAHDDFHPIEADDRMVARKLMHVSPFQTVAGAYHFNFDIRPEAIRIRILYRNENQGVVATLSGARRSASNGSLLRAALRRPFGGGRVLGLIHWQALKLFLKRAPFLNRQAAPAELVSDGLAQPSSRHESDT